MKTKSGCVLAVNYLTSQFVDASGPDHKKGAGSWGTLADAEKTFKELKDKEISRLYKLAIAIFDRSKAGHVCGHLSCPLINE
jgi:hypothetical protein